MKAQREHHKLFFPPFTRPWSCSISPGQATEEVEHAHHRNKLMVTHPGHLAGSHPDPSRIPCQGCPC